MKFIKAGDCLLNPAYVTAIISFDNMCRITTTNMGTYDVDKIEFVDITELSKESKTVTIGNTNEWGK